MVKNVSVTITDDLDGSPGAETVAFGLDGVHYEIDLVELNRARLAGALVPFIAAGRRVGRDVRRGSGPAGRPRPDRRAGRAWARAAGPGGAGAGPARAPGVGQEGAGPPPAPPPAGPGCRPRPAGGR